MIKAIAFDADGVVQSTPFFWRERLAALFDGDPADAQAFGDDFFASAAPSLVGELSFGEAIAPVLERWGVATPLASFVSMGHEVTVHEGVVELIKEQRAAGIQVVLATNQDDSRGRYMWDELGYADLFDGAALSYEVGARKPDQRFFERLLDVCGCAAEEVLFIDDSPANVAAAASVGIHAVGFDVEAQSVQELARILKRETSPPALVLEDVSKKYGLHTALDGLNVAVGAGEIYGFLGKNGAGKSTALKAVMGIIGIDTGEMSLAGAPMVGDATPLRRRIGYVAQKQNFYGWMDAVSIGGFVAGFYPTWDAAEYPRLLDLLEVPKDQKLSTFSGGMEAKLALSLALAHRPEVLVLDEPTAGMDAVARREFIQLVVDASRRAGRTTVFSTHLIDEIELAADRVGIVDEGRMIFEGTLEALRFRVRRAVVPSGESLAVDPTIRVLSDRDTNAHRLVYLDGGDGVDWSVLPSHWRLETPSLEDAFVALVGRSVAL